MAAGSPAPVAHAGRSGGQEAAVAAEGGSDDWAQEGRSGGHEEGQWWGGPWSGWDSWKGWDNGWWETRDCWIARQEAEREEELARGVVGQCPLEQLKDDRGLRRRQASPVQAAVAARPSSTDGPSSRWTSTLEPAAAAPPPTAGPQPPAPPVATP
eukprot:540477-Pyramimonas_sp.AAC.1